VSFRFHQSWRRQWRIQRRLGQHEGWSSSKVIIQHCRCSTYIYVLSYDRVERHGRHHGLLRIIMNQGFISSLYCWVEPQYITKLENIWHALCMVKVFDKTGTKTYCSAYDYWLETFTHIMFWINCTATFDIQPVTAAAIEVARNLYPIHLSSWSIIARISYSRLLKLRDRSQTFRTYRVLICRPMVSRWARWSVSQV
jgi:hypothetical protein